MSDLAMRYVICYDVPSDKRRTKLAKCLDSYGDRVQYSVFEVVLTHMLLDNLVVDVNGIINGSQDQVLIYPLCAACVGKRVMLGVINEVPGDEQVFIV